VGCCPDQLLKLLWQCCEGRQGAQHAPLPLRDLAQRVGEQAPPAVPAVECRTGGEARRVWAGWGRQLLENVRKRAIKGEQARAVATERWQPLSALQQARARCSAPPTHLCASAATSSSLAGNEGTPPKTKGAP